MKQISFREIEMLSAYLDSQLTPGVRARLESRLADDPQLASALQALRQSRAALRKLPQRRVPRNFTLTPKLAGVKPPLPRAYPVFRLASALAALLFFFASALNFVAPRISMLAASAPMPYGVGGYGGGGGAEDQALQETEAMKSAAESTAAATMVAAAPAEPAVTGTPAGTPMPSAAMPTATIEGLSVIAPTATPEILAANAPTAEVLPPDQRNIGGGADTYMETLPPQTPAQFIPGAWVWGFVIVAVIMGVLAFIVRWRADRAFVKDQPKK